MKILRMFGNRFVAPFQASRQKPCERQDNPPHRRCHTKEIDKQKDERTGAWSRRRVLDRTTVASDLFVTQKHFRQISNSHHEIAQRQKDNRPFRVLESFGVDDERGQCH